MASGVHFASLYCTIKLQRGHIMQSQPTDLTQAEPASVRHVHSATAEFAPKERVATQGDGAQAGQDHAKPAPLPKVSSLKDNPGLSAAVQRVLEWHREHSLRH
jgi:hypothetical protein